MFNKEMKMTLRTMAVRLTDNSGTIYKTAVVTDGEFEHLNRRAAEETAGNMWWELALGAPRKARER
jgi:hypothetical protein